MHDQLGTPVLEQIGMNEWRLSRTFSYLTDRGVKIVVPAGFITDGASTPFSTLITPWGGHYQVAALIHDYLYDCLNKGKPHRAAPTRKHADYIFREICRRSGVAPLVRFGMWFAIRWLGANPLAKKVAIG